MDRLHYQNGNMKLSFTIKKNDKYWDKQEVKLDEVNYQIVKEISTAVNLYETDKVDRAVISTEFVDKYKTNIGTETIYVIQSCISSVSMKMYRFLKIKMRVWH